MTKTIPLPIAALIFERCATLRLQRCDLVRRAGFKNVAKGLRRLDELCSGNLTATITLIAGLPGALELPPEIVADAIQETKKQIAEAACIAEEEAACRETFQPCAYLVGTTGRPSSGFMFEISGGTERWLKIHLDLTQSPATFADQALDVALKTPTIPFFGATVGCIVNYAPDVAVLYDVNGSRVKIHDHAYRPGKKQTAAVVDSLRASGR